MKLKSKYESIIVIGNGFDLNLGLKTSYQDFFISLFFKRLMRKGNFLVQHLNEIQAPDKWIDVESVLGQYSKNQLFHQASVSFKSEYEELTLALKEYLKGLNYYDIKEGSKSYELIANIRHKDFLIFDFNYTPTTKLILEKLNPLKQDRIVKVHGSFDGDIIFGVDDQADINEKHIFIRKAYNKNFLSIEFKELLRSCDEVCFFGHSLGFADHMYFNAFFTESGVPLIRTNVPGRLAKKKVKLYHFGEEGYRQMITQIEIMTSRKLSVFRQSADIEFIDTSV